ncbi:MAG TPA: polysaccharide deacetylase family protein [Opitutaceae bacterium]|nr:polysaccharide deacetylase family protein [Opitutaceae bacterium]
MSKNRADWWAQDFGIWLLIAINVTGKIAAVSLAYTAPATAIALFTVPDALALYHILVFRAQGLMRMHRRFSPAGREVWLTIDDGPDPEDTPRILELLARHDARATFFVIGKNVVAHPGLVRAIVAGGHEVAHHTHTHPLGTFWLASPRRVGAELDRGLVALGAAGVRPQRFRPPAGLKNLWLGPALTRRGLTCIGWSARGLERRDGDIAAVVRRATSNLAPGAILLLHEGPAVPASVRVDAIGAVLVRLQQEGYRCVVPTAQQLESSAAETDFPA